MAQALSDSARRVALSALLSVGAAMFVLTLAAIWLQASFGLSRYFSTAAAGLFALVGGFIPRKAAQFHQHARFGLANVLTVVRLAVSCLLAAFAFALCFGPAGGEPAAWIFFGCAVAALVFDGLDGFAARRSGLASPFGARFDMETDAFMILVLSVIAVLLGKAGVWVIASGLLRYLYVVTALVVPALTRPLAPAWRRKAIAAIQGAALAALLAPVIQPPVSSIIAGSALVLLIYSFGVDILAQVRGS